MRRALLLVGLLVVAAGCGGTRTVTTTVTTPAQQAPAFQQLFGTIRSIAPQDGQLLLRFDPAWWLSGVTAGYALAQDNHRTCRSVEACSSVPDDYWIVDEGHRALVYRLPATTTGTVLDLNMHEKRVTVSQLRQLIAGSSPLKLVEPLSEGVWLTIDGDRITGFHQQFRP